MSGVYSLKGGALSLLFNRSFSMAFLLPGCGIQSRLARLVGLTIRVPTCFVALLHPLFYHLVGRGLPAWMRLSLSFRHRFSHLRHGPDLLLYHHWLQDLRLVS